MFLSLSLSLLRHRFKLPPIRHHLNLRSSIVQAESAPHQAAAAVAAPIQPAAAKPAPAASAPAAPAPAAARCACYAAPSSKRRSERATESAAHLLTRPRRSPKGGHQPMRAADESALEGRANQLWRDVRISFGGTCESAVEGRARFGETQTSAPPRRFPPANPTASISLSLSLHSLPPSLSLSLSLFVLLSHPPRPPSESAFGFRLLNHRLSFRLLNLRLSFRPTPLTAALPLFSPSAPHPQPPHPPCLCMPHLPSPPALQLGEGAAQARGGNAGAGSGGRGGRAALTVVGDAELEPGNISI